MPEELVPVIIIVSIIVGIYLLILIAVGITLRLLSKAIEANRKKLNIILKTQIDSQNMLNNYLFDKGFKYDVVDYDNLDFNLTSEQRLNVSTRLQFMYNNAEDVVECNEMFKEDSKVKLLKTSILESIQEYKKSILSFNQKVVAYNYWIKFIPFRPISKMFHILPVEEIKL